MSGQEWCPTRGRYVPKGCAAKTWDTKNVVAVREEEDRRRLIRDADGIERYPDATIPWRGD